MRGNRTRIEGRKCLGGLALILTALPLMLLAASRPQSHVNREPRAAIGPTRRYQEAAASLGRFIEQQIRQHQLPAVSIALVDHERIVWAQGFGYADHSRKIPATADTVYRVGAVSDLLTDVGVLQLIEHGRLRLGAPLRHYLPDFHPRNPFDTPITLRDLLARRSGLNREPPVGGLADSSSPSLGATVASLNGVRLACWPSTQAKDSDAAGSVAGYLLQSESGEPFGEYMRQKLLAPMGMHDSSFAPLPQMEARLAKGHMWTYGRLQIDPPNFRVGVSPAEGLYSSAADLGRFITFLFAAKDRGLRPILGRKLLNSMWTPHFAVRGIHTGYGFGFRVTRLDGHRLASRSGTIYGFSSELALLPRQKLGVVVVTSMGNANGVTTHVAHVALQLMFAARHGHRLPKIPHTTSLLPQTARSFAGRYGVLATAFDLFDREGRLFYLPIEGGPMIAVRQLGDSMMLDGRLGYGIKLEPLRGGIGIGHTIFPFVPRPKPKPMPDQWKSLIGKYGWDYDTLYILEKDGQLTALADWFEYDPLREVSRDVFRFPRYGRYRDERVVFVRNADGKVTAVRAGGVLFPRRNLGGVAGEFFHINPRPAAMTK